MILLNNRNQTKLREFALTMNLSAKIQNQLDKIEDNQPQLEIQFLLQVSDNNQLKLMLKESVQITNLFAKTQSPIIKKEPNQLQLDHGPTLLLNLSDHQPGNATTPWNHCANNTKPPTTKN